MTHWLLLSLTWLIISLPSPSLAKQRQKHEGLLNCGSILRWREPLEMRNGVAFQRQARGEEWEPIEGMDRLAVGCLLEPDELLRGTSFDPSVDSLQLQVADRRGALLFDAHLPASRVHVTPEHLSLWFGADLHSSLPPVVSTTSSFSLNQPEPSPLIYALLSPHPNAIPFLSAQSTRASSSSSSDIRQFCSSSVAPILVAVILGSPIQLDVIFSLCPELPAGLSSLQLLHAAIECNHTAVTEQLLNHFGDSLSPLTLERVSQRTAIEASFHVRNRDIAWRFLSPSSHLSTPVQLTFSLSSGWTPFHLACAWPQDPSLALRLLDSRSAGIRMLQVTEFEGYSSLHLAIRANSPLLIPRLLSSAPSLISLRDNDGLSPLDLAANLGHCNILQSLLTALQITDDLRLDDTLRNAVIHKHPNCVETLLSQPGVSLEVAIHASLHRCDVNYALKLASNHTFSSSPPSPAHIFAWMDAAEPRGCLLALWNAQIPLQIPPSAFVSFLLSRPSLPVFSTASQLLSALFNSSPPDPSSSDASHLFLFLSLSARDLASADRWLLANRPSAGRLSSIISTQPSAASLLLEDPQLSLWVTLNHPASPSSPSPSSLPYFASRTTLSLAADFLLVASILLTTTRILTIAASAKLR